MKSPITVKSLYYDDGNRGAETEADAVGSTATFYDPKNGIFGDAALCKQLANPFDCVKSNVCGWCGSSLTCVAGTPKGPK